jgi:hypothetical protein
MIMLSIRNSASILVFSVMLLDDLGIVNTDVTFCALRYLRGNRDILLIVTDQAA